MKSHHPPKLAERLLLLFLRDVLAEEVLGDLDEKFGANFGFGTALMIMDFWHVIGEFRYFTAAGDDGTPDGGTSIFSIGLLYTFE